MKEEIKQRYLQRIKDMTKEEKIEFLEECRWNIDMIDRWQEKDRISYEVISEILKELKN